MEVHNVSTNYIYNNVQSRVRKSKTRNPFVIAEDNGIMLLFDANLKNLKGMYTIIKRNRIIIINDNMPEQMQNIVCAHELGHDALHRSFAKNGALQEFMLYDMKSRPESEANMYAADLLLDDDEVMELAKEGYDMQQVASILNTDINLVGLKMASMNYRGYDLRIGIEPRSDFLRS